REVLGVDADLPAVDRPEAGDDAVPRDVLVLEAEIDGAGRHQEVGLLEASLVEQVMDALARRELAARSLSLDLGGSAALHGAVDGLAQLGQRARRSPGLRLARLVLRAVHGYSLYNFSVQARATAVSPSLRQAARRRGAPSARQWSRAAPWNST